MKNVGLFAIAALGALALVPGRADAQMGVGVDGQPVTAMPLGETKQVDEATRARRDEVDRNYRAVRGAIPAQASAVDPWANMRGADETKPAPKPAQAKSATAAKKKPAQ
jgi:hypothetical protein